MNILCVSQKHSLLQRWQQALAEKHTVYQATALQDMNILLRKTGFELLLLHAPLVTPEILGRIRAALPASRLFVLSDRPDDEEGLAYLRAGAAGYANSYIAPKRLCEAVNALATGKVWVGQTLMQRLILASQQNREGDAEQGADARQRPEPLAMLSRREYQIARLVAEGLSNGEIAVRLGITERTVKAHLSSIYTKTGARGRLNLALLVNGS